MKNDIFCYLNKINNEFIKRQRTEIQERFNFKCSTQLNDGYNMVVDENKNC